MSLNKLTDSSKIDQQQWMNIGCNNIKCSSLELDGTTIFPSIDGAHVPTISSDAGSFSNSQSYYTFRQPFFEMSFKTKLTVGATPSGTPSLTIPLPPGIELPAIGSSILVAVGCGSTLAGGMINLKDATISTNNEFIVNYIHSGLNPPVTGTDVFLSGYLKILKF